MSKCHIVGNKNVAAHMLFLIHFAVSLPLVIETLIINLLIIIIFIIISSSSSGGGSSSTCSSSTCSSSSTYYMGDNSNCPKSCTFEIQVMKLGVRLQIINNFKVKWSIVLR